MMAAPAVTVRLGHACTTAGEAVTDMGRLLAGLTIYAAAFTWAVVAVWLCFGPVAALWQSLVGGLPSIGATLGSLIVSAVVARRLLRLGDRLMHGVDVADMDGRRPVARRASAPYDWVAHNRHVIRAVRQAHYCRTQQFDRLAALEREEQAERARTSIPSHDVATPTGAESAPWHRPVGSWLAPLTMGWLVLRVLVAGRPRVMAPSDATLEGAVQQAAAALATVAHVVPSPQRVAILSTATDVIQWEATTPESVGPLTRRLSYDLIAAGMRSHLEVLAPVATFWHTAASPFLAAGAAVACTIAALVLLGEFSLAHLTVLPLIALAALVSAAAVVGWLTVTALDQDWRQP
ncbi:MAG: hypothetical protein OXU67_00735 [Chloroflexota bacterium]|nr:hypothetical protein [Chloroflexota bacterium]